MPPTTVPKTVSTSRFNVGDATVLNGAVCEITNVWKHGVFYDSITLRHPDGTYSSAGGFLDKLVG